MQVPPLAAELGQTRMGKHRAELHVCSGSTTLHWGFEAAQHLPSCLLADEPCRHSKVASCFQHEFSPAEFPATIGMLLAVVFQLHYKELVAKNEELDRYKAIIDGLSGQR